VPDYGRKMCGGFVSCVKADEDFTSNGVDHGRLGDM